MRTTTSLFRFFRRAVTGIFVTTGLIIGTRPLSADTNTNTISYTQKLQQIGQIRQRLVWLGESAPSETESQELWEAFGDNKQKPLTELIGSLEGFVKAHPDSPWRFSLEVNLGELYLKSGYFSLALDRWEAVWKKTKALTDTKGSQVANSALMDWLQLLASLGRTQTMKDLLDETKGRQISDRMHYDRLRVAYAHMIHHPDDSYRCGTFALDAITMKLYGSNNYWGLIKQKSPETGFSMAALEALAESNHLGLVAVERTSGTELVAPSVVHWKEDHYAAIVTQRGAMYEVVDPTFQIKHWLTAEAINHESSGQFLVPAKLVPSGWRKLSSNEAAQIYGKGYPGPWPPSPGPPCGTTCCAPGSGGSGGGGFGGSGFGSLGSGNGGLGQSLFGSKPGNCPSCGGMPAWQVTEPDINLWVEDEPLAYHTATGDRFSFKIYYNQQQYAESAPPPNFGEWFCSWLSCISAEESEPGAVILYPPGGGQTTYTNLNGTSPEFYSNNRMFTLTNGD
jgi:hypothetical protein